MLHAMGFSDEEMPRLFVHGWWNVAGSKMSKSIGNVVDPDLLADKYGADALRYYLMRDMVAGQDADFSEDRLLTRYNKDLANDLGNLVNRAINMSQRYRQGHLSAAETDDLDLLALRESLQDAIEHYRRAFDHFQVHTAIEAIWDIVSRANGLIELKAPWKLAKDPAQSALLDAVLYTLAEAIRLVALYLSPIMPASSHRILEQLNATEFQSLNWGGLPDRHELGTPTPIFPRIDS
jgi:methionyl-tRNA synthetase